MSEKAVSIHDVTPEIAGMYAHVNLPVPPLVEFDQVDTASILQTNIFFGTGRGKGLYGNRDAQLTRFALDPALCGR